MLLSRALPISLHRLGTLAAVVSALALLPGAASAGYTSLYVFGDSLSDAGGGNANPLPPNEGGLLVPGPYSGGRVSNGPVAAEYLGDNLGLNAAQQFHYAIAGARTGPDGSFLSTGLATQVGVFAQGGANPAYTDALFMVWAGSNDLRDALGTANPLQSFAGIVSNLMDAVTTLYGLGARNFLLPNIPDVGLTPEVLAMGPAASGQVSFLATLLNDAIESAYDGLEQGLVGSRLIQFDVFAAQHAVLAAAPGNGLLNTTNGCLIPTPNAPGGQSDCSVSFFVDNIHPTTQVHATLGRMMTAAVVPEPSMMLLTATALLGLMASSRRRRGS
jgi:phospholipase/lecithinase/hemolysin